ncbi:MAG: amidohydrolase family protein [Clostridia bacterium]|nr:amidohydrolase family protein [Clostridia bacterium]
MQAFILRGGRIFDGNGFFDGDVLIENGKILEIGAVTQDGIPEFDVSGCILSSGLIDIHTHIKGVSCKEFGFPIDIACIPFGVTAAVDAGGGQGDYAFLNSLCVSNAVFLPFYLKGDELDRDKIEEAVAAFKEKTLGIKVYFDRTQNPQIGLSHLRLACRFAYSKKLKVMVHCAESPNAMLDIVETLGKGDILTHSYHGGCHTIDENDYAAYKSAKKRGVIIDAGMAGGVHTDFSILKKAIERGYVPDTISSDVTRASAYIRGGIYGLPMCMSIMRRLGMAEKDIFKAVTNNAAYAVGRETEWLYMKLGAPATLSVLKYGDTAIDITDRAGNRVQCDKGYVCKMTVVNGQILYRNF